MSRLGWHIFPWFSPPYLGALQSPFGGKMENIHTHTSTKPNVVAMDFQHKIEVSNPLQHRESSPPKRPIVKDPICGKAIGYQKVHDLKRGGNSPLLRPLFVTLDLCNPLQQKQFLFFLQIWMFMTSMFFQSTKGLQLSRVTNKTMHHLWVTNVHCYTIIQHKKNPINKCSMVRKP
jgi:hypothetical protein